MPVEVLIWLHFIMMMLREKASTLLYFSNRLKPSCNVLNSLFES